MKEKLVNDKVKFFDKGRGVNVWVVECDSKNFRAKTSALVWAYCKQYKIEDISSVKLFFKLINEGLLHVIIYSDNHQKQFSEKYINVAKFCGKAWEHYEYKVELNLTPKIDF